MNAKKWILVSGFLWLAAGFSLLKKGLQFVEAGLQNPESLSSHLVSLFGSSEQGGMILIAIGLIVGFLKGRFVLSRSAHRICSRIIHLEPPIRLTRAYPLPYWILIAGMMGLGFGMRFLPIPIDARGCIDIAIGSALVNGSLFYFRFGRKTPSPPQNT